MELEGRKEIFGCYSHLMEEITEDSFMYMILSNKNKPTKKLCYCYICHSVIRTLK